MHGDYRHARARLKDNLRGVSTPPAGALARRNGFGDLDEDALPRAVFGRRHDGAFEVHRYRHITLRPTGLVADPVSVVDIRDAVLEQHEHLRAVVDAQSVAGAEVLIYPHAVTGHERAAASKSIDCLNSTAERRTRRAHAGRVTSAPRQARLASTICTSVTWRSANAASQ